MPSPIPRLHRAPGAPPSRLVQDDYRTLAAFRYLLRRFLGFSEAAARDAGLTPHHHQALLAIKGFRGGGDVTIHDLAEQLCIRHHSAVELVDRLVEWDLVVRRPDSTDRRRVLLDLTGTAERCLAALAAAYRDELQRLRPTLIELLQLLPEPPEHIFIDRHHRRRAPDPIREAGIQDRGLGHRNRSDYEPGYHRYTAEHALHTGRQKRPAHR